MKRLNNDIFMEKSMKIHGDKYDYSLVQYNNYNIKVKIICKKHGIFEQTPQKHLIGRGCQKCGGSLKLNFEDFVSKSRQIHGGKFDYTYSNYIDYNTKIKIKCNVCGFIIEQTPQSHLKNDCPSCNKNKKYTTEEYISLCKERHNNKYNYDLVNYINAKNKVRIICPEHGEFKQISYVHLMGCGCPICSNKKHLTTKEFIEKSNKKHNNKYNYKYTEYIRNNSKVKIICKTHGEFEQIPILHLNGSGCPHCCESKGEKKILNLLKQYKIKFLRQYKFEDCKDKRMLPFDFYLPEHNCCIEYDGIQHFKPIEYFGGVKSFEILKKHDQIKDNYCKLNNINLIRIPYFEQNIENIFRCRIETLLYIM